MKLQHHRAEAVADTEAGEPLLLKPADFIFGTPDDDSLTGTLGFDSLDGGQGNDTLRALAGDDILSDFGGNDQLYGGAGNDRMNGGDGTDTLHGGGGDDFLDDLDREADTLNGGQGDNDELYGSWWTSSTGVTWLNDPDSVQVVFGNTVTGIEVLNLLLGNGDDHVSNRGRIADDRFETFGGNDRLFGGDGADWFDAGDGKDEVWGDEGDDFFIDNDQTGGDTIHGGEGTDHLEVFWGNAKRDIVWTNNPDEVQIIQGQTISGIESLDVYLGRGNDALTNTGRSANDTMVGGRGDDTLTGGAGNDFLAGQDDNDLLIGGAGDDQLFGSGGIDSLSGGAGDDELSADSTPDSLDGGDGVDTFDASWDWMTTGLVWTNDAAQVQVINGVTFVSLERLWVGTGSGDDVIDNSLQTTSDLIATAAGNDLLIGGAGSDTLFAGIGDDTVVGGAGKDSLWGDHVGEGGSDIFRLDSLIGPDDVQDFEMGIDLLAIDQAGLPVGDGDNVIEGAVKIKGPGGFAAGSELVIVTADIEQGLFTGREAAAAIGSADTAFALGQTALFVVDDGSESGLFYFESKGNDALVSAGELTLLATMLSTLNEVSRLSVGDFAFVG